MAYSPSKKPRLSSSSASSTASVNIPVATGQTLSRRASWNKNRNVDTLLSPPSNVAARPIESLFREENNGRLFKYEFPSQASLGFQDSAGTEDDETHLTGSGPAHKHGLVSPLRRRTTLQRVSRNLRRISVRVVNLGSAGVDDRHARIADETDEDVQSPVQSPINLVSMRVPESGLLRGTTLGLLGPDNPVRLAMYKFLMYP